MNDSGICPICGKSFTIGPGPGRKSHPLCSRKLQLLKAEEGGKYKKTTTRRITGKVIDYFAKVGTD
jgi:hypothetical protein